MSVSNLEKLFQYFKCIAKEPIRFGGLISNSKVIHEEIVGDKINFICLNKHFFYNDHCQMCGGCDPAESNVYSKSEYDRIMNCSDAEFENSGLNPKYLHKLRYGLYEERYRINDKDISVHVYQQEANELYLPTREKVVNRCTWCFQDSKKEFKCRIHPVESITCIMPHLRIFHFSGTHKSSIGIAQFGRNWALKCPISLTPPENEEQFEINKQNRVEKLNLLNQVGLDLNIETYLPQVIDYIEETTFENYEQRLNVNILAGKARKLF